MKNNILKHGLIALSLLFTSFVNLQAQVEFPKFSNVTPSELPQIFRGNFTLGDYNNDGYLDMVTLGRAENWAQHGILMTNSPSGFDNIADLSSLGLRVDGVYNTVFNWIDYNNDGYLDLLYMGTTGDENSNKSEDLFFHLYKNRGEKGNYKLELVNNTGLEGLFPGQEGQYAGVIAVGDYDNDGYKDVLVTGDRDGVKKVSLYKNNKGNGTFILQEGIVEGKNFDAVAGGGVVFADLNNDGYLDIIAHGWNNDVDTALSSIYLNKGDATFRKTSWSSDISKAGQTQKGQTIVGDLNNDGYLDIITTGERKDGDQWTTNTNLYFYKSQTEGTISYEEKTGSDLGVSAIQKGGGDMADFNADGLLDFVLTGEGQGTHTSFYINNGDHTFAKEASSISGVRSGGVVSTLDIDNDGYLDISVMGGWPPTLQLWKNDGNLTKNTKPTAPSDLKARYSAGKIIFSWTAGSDKETPEQALRYNLYIKNKEGEIVTIIPVDITTGKLKVSDLSTAINTTSYALHIPRGTYEWGVQTIDQAKEGSEFATATFNGDANLAIVEGNWEIVYDESNKTLDYTYNGKSILSGVYVHAKTNTKTLKSSDYEVPTLDKESVSDKFGSGTKYTLTYAGQDANLEQVFYFYPGKDYFLTEAYVQSDNSISSNYIAPVVTTTRNAFLPQSSDNRVLTVPFDNDGFVRYGSYPLSTDSVSFEVTSIFNGKQRDGLVIGSVEHDVWKTGVRFSTKDNRYIDYLECFGGITHKLTRDINSSTKKEHGSISGKSLKSPKVLVGYFEDWRKGMETYADANATIAPPRKWEKATPFGWNSWSGMETKVNYEGVIDVSDFIKNQLSPKSFDSDAVYIGLDSWWNENFTEQQLIDFVKHCEANGQKAGIYMTPFSDWWGDDGAERVMEGTNGKYKYKDAYLYSNGKPIKIESKALDPTHPGTKMMMKYNIDRFKAWGFKYIKLDFINNATLEADSFYEEGVTTGVQAYNHGMQYLVDLCGEDIFLALSIAPTFPAQYGHSKRISCDTWGQMSEHESHTGYMLNSLSFGWWLDRVYAFNDGDHLIFHDRESRKLYKEGENRARITSGAITGLYMLGDNLSLKGSYQGSQEIRDRNLQIATNAEINEIAKLGKSFYPVEGYLASGYDRSESFFMLEEGNYTYLAIFNFKDNAALEGSIELSRLGVESGLIKEIKELWTGQIVEVEDNDVPYSVPSQDVRVFKIEREVEVATKPSITSQPKSLEVFTDQSVTFSVEASGGFLTYQWYKNDEVIDKETSRFFNINSAKPEDSGNYYCVVSNTEGSAVSEKASLKVFTRDTKVETIIVNGDRLKWDDLIGAYSLPCGTSNVSLEIITEEPGAKVLFQGQEVDSKTIELTIDRPGVKTIPFSVQSESNAEIIKSYEFKVEKYFEFGQVVVVRWNNTLIANNNSNTNGGYKFKAYRWFKNGTEIGNKASYSAGPRKDMLLDSKASYYLEVTTTDDEVLRTCAENIELKPMGVSAYPNPITMFEPLNVEVDLNEELLNNAVIEIYNFQGVRFSSKRVEGKTTMVHMPTSSGIYMVKVKSGDFVETLKIIVK